MYLGNDSKILFKLKVVAVGMTGFPAIPSASRLPKLSTTSWCNRSAGLCSSSHGQETPRTAIRTALAKNLAAVNHRRDPSTNTRWHSTSQSVVVENQGCQCCEVSHLKGNPACQSVVVEPQRFQCCKASYLGGNPACQCVVAKAQRCHSS